MADAHGQIRFVGLAEGMHTITVTAAGHGTTTLRQKLPTRIPVKVMMAPVVAQGATMGAVMVKPMKARQTLNHSRRGTEEKRGAQRKAKAKAGEVLRCAQDDAASPR